ncbi:MAG TPA: hypothetical protein VNH11_07240 [Pirellulales bacterium]|nr:hypothetical protein [Pirellulales bacterium]
MSIKSRLTKLEKTRRENDAYADDPNRPPDFAELCGYPRGTCLSTIFQLEDERMAREIAAGTYKPPEPPDPDYMPENVIDVESELLKIQGNRDGWRARQLFLKRDLAEMIRREWPDIDAEPAATSSVASKAHHDEHCAE